MAVNGKVNVTEHSNSKGLLSFFKELKAEFKRITWAPKKDAKKATAAVLTFCALYIILVSLLDAGFKNIFDLVF